MTRALAAFALLAALAADASSKAPPSDKIRGLGRSCKKSSDCHSRAQRCLHESDANGNNVPQGFCALPCASFEEGTTKVVPGTPMNPAKARTELKKKAPPRCPPHFLCRSAGAGVPIDLCVKE